MHAVVMCREQAAVCLHLAAWRNCGVASGGHYMMCNVCVRVKNYFY